VQSAQHARDLGGVPELELLRPDEHGAERALLAHHPTVVESRELQGTLDLLRSVHRHARERLRDLWERDGHGRDAGEIDLSVPWSEPDARDTHGERLALARAEVDLALLVRDSRRGAFERDVRVYDGLPVVRDDPHRSSLPVSA